MAEVTTDHDTVRKWAEGKGGKPATVERTHKGGDVGIIRIMFPDAPQSQHDALTEITWEESKSSKSASSPCSTRRTAGSRRSSAATRRSDGSTATTARPAENPP